MYKAEFDKHIQNNTLSNSFVLFGESIFLIEHYTKLLSNVADASVLKFYHDEYDFNSAKAHLSQASLFGDRNILVIKSEKKVPKKDLETLVDYCEKNQNNIFIYAYLGDDNKTYAKGFSKRATMAVRFFHPKHGEAVNLISQIAKQKNVNIDNYSITHLLNIHNSNISLAINELDKFRVFDTAVSTKDIDTLVYGLGEINVDELIKKVINKKEFKDDVKNLTEHGEDEIRILTQITAYITQLYMFNIYIRVNGAPNALEILGYPAPAFVVKEKAELSLKFKPTTYYKLHELLLDAELKMKSAKGVDKNAILLSTLIKFQNLL
ncbi:DNA polymerase III subunit delta [Sulfurimonas lithotrophica]|uniref:DNA polymerase III subunit delta n=1 Tax=Sulfurimonas lithotrophica TaxID=2590022 RepID=A0A5P8P3Z3_9BACT|nr:DNA polymerase III subunit delta [Sulfurimonas lithotrophica]QFR50409.1 DNA polymerase III subunit delta [Sulfurimonas lithotrophica]